MGHAPTSTQTGARRVFVAVQGSIGLAGEVIRLGHLDAGDGVGARRLLGCRKVTFRARIDLARCGQVSGRARVIDRRLRRSA